MILADAIRAELFKLTRNRATLFWAFGLTPVATLVLGIGGESAARLMSAPLARAMPVMSAADGLGAAGNPIVLLLFIVGAGVLFAGEYRWQTWRVILPRSERASLILAKFGVFAIAAAASLFACGVFGFIVGLYSSAVLHLPTEWPPASAGEILPALALAFATSLLQSLVVAGLVALTAVITRSLMAATIAPFLILVGFEIVGSQIQIGGASPIVAALPNFASRGLRAFVDQMLGNPDAVGMHLAAPGALSLVLWIAALAIATLAVFRRQDLSEE